MKQNQNKRRTTVWLYPSTMERMDMDKDKVNCKTRSELIEQALEFYLGYLESRDATPFLSEAVLNSIEGTLQSNQNRVSNNLFRLSVELNMMMHLMGSSIENCKFNCPSIFNQSSHTNTSFDVLYPSILRG